jgi:hypothetical protein
MLSTWLNEERWKDSTGTNTMTPAEIEAANQRLDELARTRKDELDAMARRRSDELLGRSARNSLNSSWASTERTKLIWNMARKRTGGGVLEPGRF